MGLVFIFLLMLFGVGGLIFLYYNLILRDKAHKKNYPQQDQTELQLKVQAYLMGIDILVKEIPGRKLEELETQYQKRHAEAFNLKTRDHVFRIEELVYRELFHKVKSEREIRKSK